MESYHSLSLLLLVMMRFLPSCMHSPETHARPRLLKSARRVVKIAKALLVAVFVCDDESYRCNAYLYRVVELTAIVGAGP